MAWSAYRRTDRGYHRPLGWDGDSQALERLSFYERRVRVLCQPSLSFAHNEGTIPQASSGVEQSHAAPLPHEGKLTLCPLLSL